MTEFITRCYGNKEFEVIIKTDSKEHYKQTEDFARKLIDHAKLQTNADRIRAMSDEELAKVPMMFGYSCVFQNRECGIEQTCEMCLLEWLKQPAEE